MISAVISLSHPRSLWLPKCAMKWIEAKRKLMPPSLSRVFSLRGCWWRGTPPTASITKLDSAESALTRAAVLSQMQRETCKRLFHTCFTTRLLYISIQLRWWEIFTPFLPLFILIQTKEILCQELHGRTTICPATTPQWSTLTFYSISVTSFIFNNMSVNANYTMK